MFFTVVFDRGERKKYQGKYQSFPASGRKEDISLLLEKAVSRSIAWDNTHSKGIQNGYGEARQCLALSTEHTPRHMITL